MSETRKLVKTVQVDMACGKCGNGVMRPTGRVLMSSPPWYVHECSNCKAWENYRQRYPYIKYEET
jgi:hypothetical protein